ncbi:hypothetical protein [Nocardioides convexus]|uniref:CAP domain-containing protein n=1 Tax=Nocardioides convexus TaxID=2712224 RepID=UPI002418223C|nr:hypothetical protein [Nocardioides convexus]
MPGLLLGLVVSMTAAPAGSAAVAPAPAQRAQDVVPTRLLVQRVLEDRVLLLTNIERRKHGCGPLRPNAALRKSARGHTVTMALNNLMSHQAAGRAVLQQAHHPRRIHRLEPGRGERRPRLQRSDVGRPGLDEQPEPPPEHAQLHAARPRCRRGPPGRSAVVDAEFRPPVTGSDHPRTIGSGSGETVARSD